MSKPLSARLRLMLYEDIALEVEAMENEFTRLTREVERLKEFLAVESKAREGREALLRENCGGAPAPLGWFYRVRAALAPAAQATVLHPSPMNCDHSGSTYEQWTDGSVRFRCPKCGIDFTIRKDQNTDTQGAATPCGRDPCHMGLDGYCAKCHQEAYP